MWQWFNGPDSDLSSLESQSNGIKRHLGPFTLLAEFARRYVLIRKHPQTNIRESTFVPIATR
jgi:hypothetical protein